MSQRTALVVDDSRSARFALRKHLEAHAFKVDTVESARAAYEWLKEQTPDMIFLDHIMPDEDGLAALRHLKADPHTASIPVVICSSNEGEAFVAQAREEGAADVLQKPPSPEQLQRVLDQLESALALTAGEPPARGTPPRKDWELELELEPAPTSAPAPVPAAPEPPAQRAEAPASAVVIDLPQRMPAAPGKPERAPTPAREAVPAAAAFDALATSMKSRMSGVEDQLRRDLEALREQVETLMRQHAEQLEAMRAQFDADLRAAQEQLAGQITAAVRSARSQAAAEIRETLLSALREP